jgi:PGF-CTERM protein
MGSGRTVGVWVVALLLVTAGVTGTAGAQAGSAPIPIDSCRTIADEGQYVLTSDIQNSNQTVCIQILSSDVVFDGQGHTIDSGPNTTESVGVKINNSLTGLSNVTVTNVSTTDWTAGIYYLDATNGTIRNVNASANRRHGILLRAASNTRLVNVTAVNNGRWSLYAAANTTNITGIGFETRSSNVSFTASDVALTGIGAPPAGPKNRTTIGKYLGVASTSPNASLRLTVHYTDQNVTRNLTERTLRMWTTNGSGNWTKPSGVNYVNIERNRVVANTSAPQNTSVFAPAGVVETPTPTPTATAAATDTAPPTETNTTTSSNGPGFGIALALVSLLAAALAVLRRR